jgi:hypothetical protein
MTFENKKEICKKLGYNNLTPCMEKLQFLEKNGIEEFLKHNFKYDFVLGNELFLKKVIEMCGDENDLKEYEKIREKLSKKPGHLYVNTNFKRTTQPIFILAFSEGLRNISIDRRNFKTKEEELEFVKEFVKKHYKKHNGELKVWGKIANYVYESDSFDKKLIFDKDGNLIENAKITYNRANL